MVLHTTIRHHFIIKGLVKESDGKFECLGENTEIHNVFSDNKKRN